MCQIRSHSVPIINLSSIFVLFSLIFLQTRCTDEPEFSSPLVQTGAVSSISSDGAQFNGRVTYSGKGETVVGFVWDVDPNPVLENAGVVTFNGVSEGLLSATITYDLLADRYYYVRAFGKSGDAVVYGDEVKFESKGSQAPVIESFEPNSGKQGTIFQVNGHNFSGQPLRVIALLDGRPIDVLEAEKDKLTLKIPESFPLSGALKLSVLIAGKEIKAKNPFILNVENFSDFEPKTAIGGDTIRLHVNFLDPVLENNKVKVGSVECLVFLATASYVDALIPYDMPEGEYTISVINDAVHESTDKISIYSPWEILPNPNFPQFSSERGTAFAIGDDVYYGLGGVAESTYSNKFWKFSHGTQSWSAIADFPGGSRVDAISFTVEGRGFVGMGQGGQWYTDLWEYDPQANSWTKKADLPELYYTSYFSMVIGDKAFVGFRGNSIFWQYDPAADQWTRARDFPGLSRIEQTGFASDTKGYVGLGTGVSDYASYKDIWQYDPDTDQWTQKKNFPGGLRNGANSTSNGEKGFLFGGGYNSYEIWEYDGTLDGWTRRPDPPRAIGYGATICTTATTTYILGGYLDGQLFRSYLTYSKK